MGAYLGCIVVTITIVMSSCSVINAIDRNTVAIERSAK